MTNLIAMTTVQNFGVMLLAPFAFLACWSLVRLMKEARREIIPWVIIIVAVVGAIMLNSGCKPIPTDPQQPPDPPVACIDDEDVSDDVLTRACDFPGVGWVTFNLPVDELRRVSR